MKREFDGYRRLTRGIFGASSLWLGSHDVLYVRGSGVWLPFNEEYLRFSLTKLQSASLVKTRTGLVLNLVFGFFALITGTSSALLISQALDHIGPEQAVYVIMAIPSSVLALVFLTLFIVNLALGPTCVLQLQTATRLEKIRAARRLRTARRVLAELAPAITDAQTSLAATPPPRLE